MPQIRPGVLIAVIVFTVFAVYAFLAPATFRTSAVLEVALPAAEGRASLPEPLEAARRLSEAILDRRMLEKLSEERASSGAPEARAEAGRLVRQSLEIDTSDAHTFSIAYRDTNRARVQRVCNELAEYAVQRAPSVLVDRSAERAQQAKREQRIHELAAFLALHPEAAAEAPSAGAKSADRDLAVLAFYAEKANLERRLSDLERGAGTDNPYLEPSETDPKLLRRRLSEINTALNARRTALDDQSHAAPGGLSPQLRANWLELLNGLASSEEPAAAPPLPVAKLTSKAALPSWPIDPNRPLLLFFGAVFGCGFGTAFTLVARATQQRRSRSNRPPVVADLNVQVPPAPPIPSGLGPEVPVLQAAPAPPIVPIPQRQISSPVPGPPAEPAAVPERPPSNPPRSNKPRFASTLVLPPAQNPMENMAEDPALAAAAQVWEEQIRSHAVPGFAVVRPRSEPPGAAPPPSEPPAPVQAPVPEVREARSARPAQRPHQMKVTQPLGSFVADLLNNPPEPDALDSYPPPREPAPPRGSAAPRSPQPSQKASAPPPDSRYSYVSSTPPPEANNVTTVRPAPVDWAPDPTLDPASRRPICEQLYPLAVQGCLVVLVVGEPDAAEQKSRVAAELALAIAASGHPRILLMEGDMQSPRVHGLLNVNMPMRAGFSQQLRDRINGGQGRRWTVVSCGKTLHVLAEGLMRSPGLLLSRHFAESFAELRHYYDFIIIDGPSSSLPVEARALDSVSDGIVFVSRKAGSPGLHHLQALFGNKRITTIAFHP